MRLVVALVALLLAGCAAPHYGCITRQGSPGELVTLCVPLDEKDAPR